jgi:hypothetical protein
METGASNLKRLPFMRMKENKTKSTVNAENTNISYKNI